MWSYGNTTITMTKGDYGVGLAITVKGVPISANDSLQFRISRGSAAIIKMDFPHPSNNKVEIVLTKEQSDKLPVGVYNYGLDWYRDGEFMYSVIPSAQFKVEAKA